MYNDYLLVHDNGDTHATGFRGDLEAAKAYYLNYTFTKLVDGQERSSKIINVLPLGGTYSLVTAEVEKDLERNKRD